jgi:hypothetical protein
MPEYLPPTRQGPVIIIAVVIFLAFMVWLLIRLYGGYTI